MNDEKPVFNGLEEAIKKVQHLAVMEREVDLLLRDLHQQGRHDERNKVLKEWYGLTDAMNYNEKVRYHKEKILPHYR